MAGTGYKKYMKKGQDKNNELLKLFVISFFGMLLVFTFLIKSFTPSVDTSIGDYKNENTIDNDDILKANVDGRLAMIQEEDRGRNFTELVRNVEKEQNLDNQALDNKSSQEEQSSNEETTTPKTEPVYKVYIGTYTSSESAKIAKELVQEQGGNLNPIIKCLGTNNYTLQVGLFKNKTSAEALLYTIQENHLPGRIVQDY